MKDRSLLPLKMLVWGMGVVLVGGFIWVAALLASRIESKEACAEITLPVGETRFEDGFWIVTRENEILRFDGCGKLVQRVKNRRT